MFYELAQALDFPGILNLIRYLSFRAGAAALTALVIGLLIGPKFIGWLRLKRGKGQPIREDGPASHFITKKGKPTIGGLMILAAMTLSRLLWMAFSNRYTWRSEEKTSEIQSPMRISYAVFCLQIKKTKTQ